MPAYRFIPPLTEHQGNELWAHLHPVGSMPIRGAIRYHSDPLIYADSPPSPNSVIGIRLPLDEVELVREFISVNGVELVEDSSLISTPGR
jgi:hypothetical protein